MESERVVVAELLRPQGNRGEVLAEPLSDVPGRLQELKRAQARLKDGADVVVEIEKAWEHKGRWVLKFAGVDTISSAERFQGAELWVPRAERGALPEGEFFRSDLIGCVLVDEATGETLGVIRGWLDLGGGVPLLEVETKGREALVPFAKGIYHKVDLEARTVTVTLPEGLLDL